MAVPGPKWNYEGAEAVFSEVVVPEWEEGDPPLAWWRHLIGQTVKVVLVKYHDQRHLLYDGDGSGEYKVMHGGGPNLPHKSLPLRAWEQRPVAQPILVESVTDFLGTFEVRWMCEPPAKNVGFFALEEEWSEDYTVRTIRQIQLADEGGGVPTDAPPGPD